MLFNIALENYNCKVKITSTKVGVSLGAITGLIVRRKEYGDSTWYILANKSILTMDDLNYVLIDKYTLSRHTYVYSFVALYDGAIENDYGSITDIISEEYTIECNFDSIYISDASAEYVLSLNLTYDYDNNQKVLFQELLQSKYPRRIQNGLSDYDSGSIEALPLKIDSYNRYITTGAYQYKQEYISFLRNGLDKILKTYKGDAWLVSINSGIKINQGEFEGAETVKFDWTEVGAFPKSDTNTVDTTVLGVVDYGLITVSSVSTLDYGLIV